MNDIPFEIIVFLKEKALNKKTVSEIKMLLMDELKMRGKEAKKYAKWWIGENNGNN